MALINATRVVAVSLVGVAVLAGGPSRPAAAAGSSPSPTTCAGTEAVGTSVDRQRVAAGDVVHVLITDRDSCQSTQPAHHFELLASTDGEASFSTVAAGDTDADGNLTFTVQPQVSTTYNVKRDGVGPIGGLSRTVQVDRVSGSCADVVRLSAPARISVGGVVPVTGRTSASGDVQVAFKRRGEDRYQVRRTIAPATDGTFTASYNAIDDYSLFGTTSRCDSPAVLVTVVPTITGPPSVERGQLVKLVVRTIPGQPVSIHFRRAGAVSFSVRRYGCADASGVYRTAYLADTDYRYYATSGPDNRMSGLGLTQVQR